MKCPVCSLELIAAERSGIELDCCIQCQGFWFDAGELNLVAEALGLKTTLPDFAAQPAVATMEKPRRCPRCAKAMEKIRIGRLASIVIDRCSGGEGLWFDKGELAKVLEQYRQEGTGQEMVINFLGETFSG